MSSFEGVHDAPILFNSKGVPLMKGMIPTLVDETTTMIADIPQNVSNQSLRNSVRESLRQYFIRLEGQTPINLYEMVLAEVEQPMLEMVLQYTGQNQSKAAKILGLSRGTLRKKMAQYDLFKNRANE
jgi:Fis family transcriptional regulator, factor for inversion stimulation protein